MGKKRGSHIHPEVDSSVSPPIQRNAALALSMLSGRLSTGEPRATFRPGSPNPRVHHNPLDEQRNKGCSASAYSSAPRLTLKIHTLVLPLLDFPSPSSNPNSLFLFITHTIKLFSKKNYTIFKSFPIYVHTHIILY